MLASKALWMETVAFCSEQDRANSRHISLAKIGARVSNTESLKTWAYGEAVLSGGHPLLLCFPVFSALMAELLVGGEKYHKACGVCILDEDVAEPRN